MTGTECNSQTESKAIVCLARREQFEYSCPILYLLLRVSVIHRGQESPDLEREEVVEVKAWKTDERKKMEEGGEQVAEGTEEETKFRRTGGEDESRENRTKMNGGEK